MKSNLLGIANLLKEEGGRKPPYFPRDGFDSKIGFGHVVKYKNRFGLVIGSSYPVSGGKLHIIKLADSRKNVLCSEDNLILFQ